MKHALTILAALLLAALPARAEVELSLTIEGTAEEIAAVLQFLQTSGLSGGGGMQVQVESTFQSPSPAPEAPPAPAPPPAPALALTNASVAPVSVRPGSATLLSVDVVDTNRAVDTVAAVVGENVFAVDLYDNGMNGDVAAGDGRWSALVNVPQTLADGAYTINIHSYDAQGAPLTIPGADGVAQAVSAVTTINVSRT